MALEKWLIHPGETRVIDVDATPRLKIGLVGGQVDVVAHDEPTVRIEVHGVTVKDLRVEVTSDLIEIDHPQLRWDNFLEVFRNFGSGGPRAEISVAVPRSIALTLGVVSAQALVTGLAADAKINTVSGDLLVDGHLGDLSANAVSGETQVRGLTGRFSANSVSGDIAVTGELSKVNADTVSGTILIDATGPIHAISLNTISGDMTVRLDEGLSANYVARSVSGRIQIDGATRSTGGPTTITDTVGELNGSFVDLRANGVSANLTVLRRVSAGAPSAGAASQWHPQPEDLTSPTATAPAPGTPVTDAASTPGAPVAPHAPGSPEAPAAPQAPSAPEFPGAPGVPEDAPQAPDAEGEARP